jgi:squalene-hopene/tetraprenyl-beta-curcumene cyclase
MSIAFSADRIHQAIDRIVADLALSKGTSDHWTGALSTSALSTATAVSALSICRSKVTVGREHDFASDGSHHNSSATWDRLIEDGSAWLVSAQNEDGGFGDTDRSLSNIATTLLVLAAWKLAGHSERYASSVLRAQRYVEHKGSWDGLRARYGKDKTFVVPIMTNCALAGMVDWEEIPSLPFEAAALPQAFYRFVQLPVVSYAIPALVAIGQAQYFHRTPVNPLTRWMRRISVEPTRKVLTRMQPTSGGYLEAVPLTSFVLMSLASIGQFESRVGVEARKFIVESVLDDGSWPIDTNLATWVTSLASIPYFSSDGYRRAQSEFDRTIDWLLSCQHVKRHPFTGALPGGWGWTNLSGAVPDADDTPAALLTLRDWFERQSASNPSGTERSLLADIRLERVLAASAMGVEWLLGLQNRDGGWPTFCRGWGALPFDRSGSDLTAHAIRALLAWRPYVDAIREGKVVRQLNKRFPSIARIDRSIARGWSYLERTQRADGSWLPLWFGNQDRIDEDNPIYGTGRVLLGLVHGGRNLENAYQSGVHYLLSNQNRDGSWGGGPNTHYSEGTPDYTSVSGTIEETAIALEGIMTKRNTSDTADSILMGLDWLCNAVQSNHHRASQPIGFYFARLWYYEKMYPLVFSLSALNKGLEFCHR